MSSCHCGSCGPAEVSRGTCIVALELRKNSSLFLVSVVFLFLVVKELFAHGLGNVSQPAVIIQSLEAVL